MKKYSYSHVYAAYFNENKEAQDNEVNQYDYEIYEDNIDNQYDEDLADYNNPDF